MCTTACWWWKWRAHEYTKDRAEQYRRGAKNTSMGELLIGMKAALHESFNVHHNMLVMEIVMTCMKAGIQDNAKNLHWKWAISFEQNSCDCSLYYMNFVQNWLLIFSVNFWHCLVRTRKILNHNTNFFKKRCKIIDAKSHKLRGGGGGGGVGAWET